jgi:hypothetical protein
MTFDTRITERQAKAKEVPERIYAVASHLFLLGTVLVYVVYAAVRLGRSHLWLGSVLSYRQIGLLAQVGLLLGVIALLLSCSKACFICSKSSGQWSWPSSTSSSNCFV